MLHALVWGSLLSVSSPSVESPNKLNSSICLQPLCPSGGQRLSLDRSPGYHWTNVQTQTTIHITTTPMSTHVCGLWEEVGQSGELTREQRAKTERDLVLRGWLGNNYCIMLPVKQEIAQSVFFLFFFTLCGCILCFVVFRLRRLTFTTDILQNMEQRWRQTFLMKCDTLKHLVCSQVLIPVRPHSVFLPPGWTHFYYRIRSGRVRLLSMLISQMFQKRKVAMREMLKLGEPSEMFVSPSPVDVIVNQPSLRLTLRWMAEISRPHPWNIHLMVCYLNPVIGSDTALLHTRLGSSEKLTTYILNWHKTLYGVQHRNGWVFL